MTGPDWVLETTFVLARTSFIRRDGRGRLSRASLRNEILATAVGAASSVASMGDYLVAAGGPSVRFYDGAFAEVCSVEVAGAVIAVCRSRGPEGRRASPSLRRMR